jgi:hypothetical protein
MSTVGDVVIVMMDMRDDAPTVLHKGARDAAANALARAGHDGCPLTRHCEERSDEPIHLTQGLDCFAPLAMTREANA